MSIHHYSDGACLSVLQVDGPPKDGPELAEWQEQRKKYEGEWSGIQLTLSGTLEPLIVNIVSAKPEEGSTEALPRVERSEADLTEEIVTFLESM